jgi:uncharacterized membrane protein YkgB
MHRALILCKNDLAIEIILPLIGLFLKFKDYKLILPLRPFAMNSPYFSLISQSEILNTSNTLL